MSDTFDPYHAWLGIPPEEQPPNHYQLLGVRVFERSFAVIEAAADERKGMLQGFQKGEHGSLAFRLINEVALARVCLLNRNRKAAYDRGLRQSLAAEEETREIRVMGSEEFLALLEKRDLLPAAVIENLRRQAGRSKEPMAAAMVAKRLVDMGHLTPALARRLLAAGPPEGHVPCPTDGREGPSETPAAAPESQPTARQGVPEPTRLQDESEELQLAPIDDEPAAWRYKRMMRKLKQRASLRRPLNEGAERAAGQPEGDVGMSPLEELLSEVNLDPSAAGGPLTLGPRRGVLRRLFSWKIDGKASQRDSLAILVGRGALLALLILAPVLIWALTRQSGDDALRQADEHYRAGSYTKAISNYNEYLQRFPNHTGVSIARVSRGLARLRQATPRVLLGHGGTIEWPNALQVAKQVLSEISPEEEFNKAHGDLAAILLAIAEGLAAQARQNPSSALVDQTNETIALMEKYVPKSLRRGEKIAKIQASLALSVHEISRGEELGQALGAMKKAISQGDTQQAYKIRKTLLKQYPRLADNDQLRQAVLEVSKAQREAVEVVRKEQPSEAREPTTQVLSTVTLARRTTNANVSGVEGHVVFALADGAAYGLDAVTGKVLWRRFVGFDANGRSIGFPPTPISRRQGSDVLFVDPVRNEVLRVEAATGGVVWRHPIGQRFDAHPVVAGKDILVATLSGRLVTIDAASGSSSGYVQVPQPLPVAPAVDFQRSLIFQMADHANLFVLTLFPSPEPPSRAPSPQSRAPSPQSAAASKSSTWDTSSAVSPRRRWCWAAS